MKMKTQEKLAYLNALGKNGAQVILEKFGFDEHFPIDITKLIRQLGVKVIQYDFSELEHSEKYAGDFYQKGNILGAAAANGANIGIFCKKNENISRVRFILAHEFAHCCLHMTSLDYDTYIDFRKDIIFDAGKEFEANVFAGELLMPEDALIYVHIHLVKPYLESLARIFGVPEAVMKARLDYLDLKYIERVGNC